MNQEKVGIFISETRKQKNLTQKELAEKINVSDKTISKWETGKSLPDITYISELCVVLDINVNELLAGERLSDHNYSKKAEETIMTLIKENETNKKTGIVSLVGGIVLLLVAFVLISVSTMVGITGLRVFPAYFIDAPSLIFLLIFEGAILLLSGCKNLLSVLNVLDKTILPTGFVIAFIGVIEVFAMTTSTEHLIPNICVAVLPLFYAFLVKILAMVVLARKK